MSAGKMGFRAIISRFTGKGETGSDVERATVSLSDLTDWTSSIKTTTNTREALLRTLAASPNDAVLVFYKSNLEGLSDAEAATRLTIAGKNELSAKKPMPWWQQLLWVIPNPFNILLGLLAVISAATPPPTWSTFIILLIMIAISCAVRFWQEYKSSIAAIKLQSSIHTEVHVLRQPDSAGDRKSEDKVIGQDKLVPGDILRLNPGDNVPADCLLLDTTHLQIAQSSLTGESEPLTKTSRVLTEKTDIAVFDLDNLAFMGTSVISGSATALVLATGDCTLISSITKQLVKRRPTNAFDRGIRNVSFLMIGFMTVMVSLVLIINGELTKNWGQAALFSVSVAVGVVPEMLPAIVNANLARGAYKLSKKRAIVKRLDAVQNLGGMTVLCSDKTGTLTKDQISMQHHENLQEKDDERILQLAYTNALFQSGKKNSIDEAIIKKHENLENAGPVLLGEKMDEIPFDFEKRRSSAIVRTSKDILLICKGAFEEVVSLCNCVRVGDQVLKRDPALIDRITKRCHSLNEDGYRVLAVATRVLHESDLTDADALGELDSFMVLEGILTFLDPPKDDAVASIAELQRLGVQIKVLTGDNLRIAAKVCRTLNITGNDSPPQDPDDLENGQGDGTALKSITGPELARLSGDDFHATVASSTVFAKLTPAQKGAVVMSLKKVGGHDVGMLGDGINDCIALRCADVGISVESAVNVAKECADVILTEKELSIVVDGVKNGRVTHGNTIKYIKMVASSNVGNVFSVLIASAWLPYEPMTALQILLQNLLYDVSQIALPWDRMDNEYVARPRKWDTWDLLRFVAVLAPTSSTIDMCTFNLNWFYYGIRTANSPLVARAHTHWFLEGLLTQTMIVHLLRTAKVPFIQSWAAPVLVASTCIIMAIGLALPYVPPIARALQLVHPAGTFLGFLAAELVLYCVEVQIVKVVYIWLFKTWL